MFCLQDGTVTNIIGGTGEIIKLYGQEILPNFDLMKIFQF